MKHTLIFFALIVAVPCSAQWKSTGGNIPIVAFGVHDTSLFFSMGSQQQYPPSMFRINPDGDADTGLDFSQGNFTTFASAGPNYFAGSYNSDDVAFGALTTNNGSTWRTVVGGPVGSNGTYVFGRYSKYISLSTDQGATWQHLSYPNGAHYAGTGAVVYSVTAGYWASTSSAGLWRSLDSGHTWSHMSLQPPFMGTIMSMGSLLFLYQDNSISFPNGMLLISHDSGMVWDTVQIDTNGKPVHIDVLATDGKNLFAGGGGGVLLSDTGKTWHVANDGLGQLDVLALGVYPYDTTLYVSTTNAASGLSVAYNCYYRPIRELIDSTPESVVQQLRPGDSIEIYPNPAKGTVTITSGAPILGVEIRNILGEDVMGSEYRSLGSGVVSLDVSKEQPGTYFIAVQTEAGISLNKITIVR